MVSRVRAPVPARPVTGLRLKIILLLLAIQAPALAILALSTTGGVRDLVREMAGSQADRLVLDLQNRLMSVANPALLQAALDDFMRPRRDILAVDVYIAEESDLRNRAFWGEKHRPEPGEDDRDAFGQAGTVRRVLEPPNATTVIVHRAFRDPNDKVIGVIRVETDQSDLVAQVEASNRPLLIGMIVTFALTVGVLLLGMHLLVVSPVARLVGTMGRLRDGRLDLVAMGFSRDEIGWLAMSYNDMVYRLRAVLEEKENLLGEVKDLNQSLQGRVQAATKNLENTNRELEEAYQALFASKHDHERLERLASLGQVAREIAHELATPLNVISGTLQMLLEDQDLKPEHRERVGRLLSQTERLIQISRDTLSPLKMPAPELGAADLNALVGEMAAFMAPAFKARRVEFIQKLAEGLPRVRADVHQIEQVLLNLVSNALDALPSGGRISVETRADPGGKSPGVLLVVRDNGVGIVREHLARIFDPFFSTKGAGRGTGLGLSICKEIVQQHRGEIRIESAPGRGSAVTIRLPAAVQAPGAAA